MKLFHGKGTLKYNRFFIPVCIALLASGVTSCDPADTPRMPAIVDSRIVHREDGYFMGWPANNGIWMWEDGEILVGFSRGRFAVRDGHNIEPPHESWLARSLDGGQTWEAFQPGGFVVDSTMALQELTEPLDFSNGDFALRVIGFTYHGSRVSKGGFFYSTNRGSSWSGPFAFNGLSQSEELKGMRITARTEYLVENKNSALLFMSAMDASGSDKAFAARLTDGGLTFEFLSWIVDHSDPSYAIMPDAVRAVSGKLVVAVRRRSYIHKKLETVPDPYCWLDVYASDDNGVSWYFLSRAAETGPRNGNPPDLIQLSDGRLCLTYGNREDRSRMMVRFSSDDGKSWGPEFILREGHETDIGYPQMVQRKDGNVVTIYYWAASPDTEKYIESTIWDPGTNWGQAIALGPGALSEK